MAGNKILPFGTAFSAMCPMIYHSININWWWWSRITQTTGSSAELFSYLSHLPPRRICPEMQTFCLTQNQSSWETISTQLNQKVVKKVTFAGKCFVNYKPSLSLSFSLLFSLSLAYVCMCANTYAHTYFLQCSVNSNVLWKGRRGT